jgi:hypothetical protein
MFRGLHRLMIAAADWHPRDFMIGAIGAELVTLFTIICLGFGTFAAYTHFSASQGPVFAAIMISATYGVVAVICGVALMRWHERSSRPASAAPAPPENLEAFAAVPKRGRRPTGSEGADRSVAGGTRFVADGTSCRIADQRFLRRQGCE